MTRTKSFGSKRAVALHVFRVALLIGLLATIHMIHRSSDQVDPSDLATRVSIESIHAWFPTAATLTTHPGDSSLVVVTDESQAAIGYLAQTSPQSDQVIGFSGPTNLLIGLDQDHRIVGLRILASRDTRDHVLEVKEDRPFWRQWIGRDWASPPDPGAIDAVSGATLTSHAITESLIARMGGRVASTRFSQTIQIDEVQSLLPEARRLSADAHGAFAVLDGQDDKVGRVIGSSPYADQTIGYQGPTHTWLVLDSENQLVGLVVGESYDNQPYVDYVRYDHRFPKKFQQRSLSDLAELDLVEERIQGVSGATMTSMAVAEGITVAADGYLFASEEATSHDSKASRRRIDWRSIGTVAVVCIAVVIGLGKWRANRWARWGLQGIVIVYLGLINGDLLSQALIFGWAQHGVPWQRAFGLCFLSFAAVLIPIGSKSNLYCSHICPHGAVQQIIKRRVPWQWRMPKRVRQALAFVPLLVLAWCIIVSAFGLRFSLVDVEPFDAWVIGVAGIATIGVAAGGLLFSLFVPMGYCRYGCPTGALLKYIRFNRKSGRWAVADSLAIGLVLLALASFVL